jgi:hypothetical protein
MGSIPGQEHSVDAIAIYYPDVGPIERQPRGVVQTDIRSAGSFIYDLPKTF